MKKILILLFIFLIKEQVTFSQPFPVDTTGLRRNLVYLTQADVKYNLDLWSISSAASVPGAKPSPLPVIIWLPKPGTKKFPCPASGFKENGYAVISVEHSSDGDILKTVRGVNSFIKSNSIKYNLDPKNVGVIEQVERGYLAVIWDEGIKRLQVLSDAKVRIGIAAVDDSTFTGFRKPDNLKQVTGFFDRHLRNGVHIQPALSDTARKTR